MVGELIIGTQLLPYLTTLGKGHELKIPEGAHQISSLDVGAYLKGFLLFNHRRRQLIS